MQLVLSMYSGVGLLDQAFREAGFCVVSAGDLITGQDIRDFTGLKNKFAGCIGGPPCPGFSGLNRNKLPNNHPDNYSLKMMYQFLRVVSECEPDWYLMENVKGVPNVTELLDNNVTYHLNKDVTDLQEISVTLRKYNHQRIDINQGWYDDYSRLRHIQFGSKQNLYLDIPRGTMSKNIIGGCALASDDRSFKELCYIQGLPSDYDLPDFNVKGKKKAVGNGVPLSIGRVLAKVVLDVTDPGNNSVTLQHQLSVNDREEKTVTQQDKKRCACGCGRELIGRKKSYDSTCRKRVERKNSKCDLAAQQNTLV